MRSDVTAIVALTLLATTGALMIVAGYGRFADTYTYQQTTTSGVVADVVWEEQSVDGGYGYVVRLNVPDAVGRQAGAVRVRADGRVTATRVLAGDPFTAEFVVEDSRTVSEFVVVGEDGTTIAREQFCVDDDSALELFDPRTPCTAAVDAPAVAAGGPPQTAGADGGFSVVAMLFGGLFLVISLFAVIEFAPAALDPGR